MTRRRARAFGIRLVLATVLAAAAAAASLDLAVTPSLGADAPAEHGWLPFAVRLRAGGTATERGTVELTDGSGTSTRATYAVAPGEQVTFELYSHDSFGKGLGVIASDASGAVVARAPVSSLHGEAPLLVDLGRTARLEAALRGERVAVHRSTRSWVATGGLELAVTHPGVDARSGELVLPERGLAYANATVVLVSSDVLVALPEKSFRALLDWVYAGGSLALTATDGTPLTHPRLVALFGGTASLEPATELARHVDFEFAETESSPALPATYAIHHAAPAEAVVAKLARVTGGKLAPTRWGSSRSAGLGEVHALAFDPTAAVFVDDPWVRRSMVDLVREGWDRRALVALAGDAAFDESRTDGTRKLLDPNEGSRWSIWVSALVLVVYALLAGPLSFRRAARRGTPLRAFVELPLWSVGTAILIVLVGAFAKGGRSRARRLSLVECGAGEPRAGVVRFRALFASSAASLRVAATDPSSLLDVTGGATGLTRSLVLGHETAELVDLRGRPWETVLVREDGMVDLSGSVRFVGVGPGLAVENGLPHDLVAVVAHAPGGELRYFPRLRHGERVRLDAGKPLSIPPSVVPAPLAPALPSPHRLDAYRFGALADADVPGSSAAWTAIEYAGRDATDYWPDDRPALLGELLGGDGAVQDSGLAIDYDRVLVRVVGSNP